MDLSSIEGLTEEQQSAVLSLHETETKGLRDNRDTLLTEKQEAKRVADEASAAAKAAADKAALAEAKKAGDLQALEKTLKEQAASELDRANSEVNKYKEMVLGGKRDTIVTELSNQFVSPEAAKMILTQMVDVSAGDDGAVATFKDSAGNTITTDPKVFAEWLKGQDAFKPLLKGVDSAGGGAKGSTSSGGAGAQKPSGNFMKMSTAERVAHLNSKLGG